jgi:hypothetical protein
MTDASLKFSDRDIRAIISALPDGINARKLELLPGILDEWTSNYLKFSLYRVDPTVAEGRAKRAEAIARHARELSRALDEFVDYARGDEFLNLPGDSWLVFELAKRSSPMGFQDEVSSERQKLEDQRKFLGELEAIASDLARSFERQIDQRRNIPAYRVVLDIAAIFEWLTNKKATRRVEYGLDIFGDFARLIWPVIFQKGDDGLEAALKNWAKYTKTYGDASPLIGNINFRHPAWRVFES